MENKLSITLFLKHILPLKEYKSLRDNICKAYNTEKVIIIMGMEKENMSITNLETNQTVIM